MPNELVIYSALVILGSLAIYWLTRTEQKPAAGKPRNISPSLSQLVHTAQARLSAMRKPKVPAPQANETISILEKRLAEMDAKITQLSKAPRQPADVVPSPARGHAAQNAYAANAKAPVTAASSPRDIRVEVYRLAEAGQDSVDIAEALNISRGEVELILNLREP